MPMKIADLESRLLSNEKDVALFKEANASDVSDLIGRVTLLETTVKNLQAQITTNESTIIIQKHNIDVLRNELGRAYGKIDDNLQYSKRMNLKIYDVDLPAGQGHVPESNDDVKKIVSAVSSDLGVLLEKSDVLRAHRTGPKKEVGGVKKQDIIVRFRSWESRCKLYKARPTRKSPRANPGPPPFGFKGISLDVTKRNSDLVKKARDMIKERFPDDDNIFALTDINCNQAISYNRKMYYFSTDDELLTKIDEISKKRRSGSSDLVQ